MFLCQMSGIPGTGKSTLAKLIGLRTGAAVLNTDIIKSALLSSFDSTLDFRFAGKASYDVVFALADDLLSNGMNVVIDSPCGYEIMLERGGAIAAKHGAAYKFVECYVPDLTELNRRRTERETLPSQMYNTAIDATAFTESMDGLKRPANGDFLRINTSGIMDEYIRNVLDYLARQAQGPGEMERDATMRNWIWDFDGTLFDSYPRMNGALMAALAEQGVRPPQEESLRRVKISVRHAVGEYAKEHRLDAVVLLADYKRFEAESDLPLTPYPGMTALCQAHCAAGGRHYLYTHRDASALRALQAHGLDGCFCDAITIEDPFPAKPAPDALLHLIKKHDLEPQDTVMIGDRDIDVIAAENAGIWGCLFDPEHFYDAYETKLRTDTVEGLERLLDGRGGSRIGLRDLFGRVDKERY